MVRHSVVQVPHVLQPTKTLFIKRGKQCFVAVSGPTEFIQVVCILGQRRGCFSRGAGDRHGLLGLCDLWSVQTRKFTFFDNAGLQGITRTNQYIVLQRTLVLVVAWWLCCCRIHGVRGLCALDIFHPQLHVYPQQQTSTQQDRPQLWGFDLKKTLPQHGLFALAQRDQFIHRTGV